MSVHKLMVVASSLARGWAPDISHAFISKYHFAKEITMNYTTNIEGFEDQNIVANVGFWTGTRLLVNGAAAPKGNKRGEMVLQRNDGRQVTATWKPQFLGLDVPQLSVDGQPIVLVKPLKWYQ